MDSKTRNRLTVAAVLALPVLVLLAFIVCDYLTPPAAPALPNPNGYDDFVTAGNMLTTNIIVYHDLEIHDLQALVKKDAPALQLARGGFQKECQVPLDRYYPVSTTNKENEALTNEKMDRWVALKLLAFGFAVEGQLAQMEDRTHDATQSYLDLVRLANDSSRGGLLLDQMIGVAMENMGTAGLQEMVPTLDAASCRETAATLETLDSQRETWDQTVQQENDWSHRKYRGLRYELVRLFSHKTTVKIDLDAKGRFEAEQLKTRELMMTLAARAYLLDHQKPAASIHDLVPAYLKAVPQNPSTGHDLTYPFK